MIWLCIIPLIIINCIMPLLHGELQENQSRPGIHIPFELNQYIYSWQTHSFFISKKITTKESVHQFNLAALSETGKLFNLAPAKVILNNVAAQDNPLFKAPINNLTLVDNKPLCTIPEKPSTVFITHNIPDINKPAADTSLMVESLALKDLVGNECGGIVNCYGVVDEDNVSRGIFYAAVKNNAGEFGAFGSGIVSGELVTHTVDGKTTFSLTQLDKVIPLDTTSPLFRINEPLASIDNAQENKPVALHWDNKLSMLYVGVSATSNVRSDSGVIGILVNGLPCVPASALYNNGIVGDIGSSIKISINYLKIMRTSTALTYLIIAGGVGTSIETEQTVYALPIVTLGNERGYLANKNLIPKDTFSAQRPYIFMGRGFTTMATQPNELASSMDVEACVGRKSPLPGTITDLFIQGDRVFVIVENVTKSEQSGVFSSQALFDQYGRIKGWTSWERSFGINEPLVGAFFDINKSSLIVIPRHNDKTLITSTFWSSGNSELSKLIEENFSPKEGGITSMHIMPELSSASSLLLLGGLRKLLMISVNANNKISYSNVAPGKLNSIGIIRSTALIHDGINYRIVVGGTEGLGIIAQDNTDIIKIGNYKDIRKICADNNYVYIVTPTHVDRFIIAGNNVEHLQSVTLASVEQLSHVPNLFSFTDFIVSGDCALLGSTAGLLRVGNNCSIQQATSCLDVGWTLVPMAERLGPVTRLVACSPTGLETDWATVQPGGLVYAINADTGYHQTRVYRYTITPSDSINDATCVPLPDYYVKDIKSFFTNVGDFRNFFATDGTFTFFTRSAYAPKKTFPFVDLVTASLQSGARFAPFKSMRVLNFPEFKTMSGIVRCSATGCWMVSGDFGLRIHSYN